MWGGSSQVCMRPLLLWVEEGGRLRAGCHVLTHHAKEPETYKCRPGPWGDSESIFNSVLACFYNFQIFRHVRWGLLIILLSQVLQM